MSVSTLEAREFLSKNQELLDEMILYHQQLQNNPGNTYGLEEYDNEDDLIMSRYHKLRTYILEKKMGLLNNNP